MVPLALFSWPLVSIAIFNNAGRVLGLILSVLIGALILPEAIEYDLPGLPPYDKDVAIVAGLLLGIWLSQKPQQRAEKPDYHGFSRKLIVGLACLLLATSVITVLANREWLTFGPASLPGLGVRDIITMFTQSLVFIIPFWAAQRFLVTPEHHGMLLRAFVVAGLVYSLLILFEVRMSPQLHRWVYGYFQHGWAQHIRGGQFRPIVFQPHGLWIGALLLTSSMAAFVLLRQHLEPGRTRSQYVLAGFWLALVLVVSRNFGATALALMFVPLLWVLAPRMQVWVSAGVMAVFLIFPMLRQAEVVTMDGAVSFVGKISAERQASFSYRVENEKLFLKRAAIKPVTGWGIWARWRIRDEKTGEDISTTDGRWISILGERGWLGFIGYFGLLTAPVFLLLRRRSEPIAPETAGLALIMAPLILYQIPNNTIGPLTLVLAGALAGIAQRKESVRTADTGDEQTGRKRAPAGYTRFPAAAPSVPDSYAAHSRTGGRTPRAGRNSAVEAK